MEDFSAILIAARERLAMTQAQLAIAAGLTPSYLSLLENRKKPPPSDRVCERLAAVLGIPARQLLEVAHLQRSPATVQRNVRALRGKLSRERKSRQRALESLLSPFLFPSAPSWLESAVEFLGGSSVRRRRLRDVLTALGRRHQDRATAVSRLVDELSERDRRLLLEALPKILGERDATGRSAAPHPPQLFYALPPAGESPQVPYLLAWSDDGPPGAELRKGDRLLVDPDAKPEDGDMLLLRGTDGAARARRLIHAGRRYRLAAVGAPALAGGHAAGTLPEDGPDLDESALRDLLAREGAGVVVEIRRPAREQPE